MLKSDSEAIVPERHRSLDKNKEENRQRERDSRRDREMRERVTHDFKPIYKAAELPMHARVQ
jgi:hypothetical protein